MALDEFKWCTQTQSGGGVYTTTDRVRELQFGNGLKQITSDGFNTTVRTFSISYSGENDEFSLVEDFVKSHLITPFAWVTPRGDLGVFTVKSNSINVRPLGGDSFELTCQFVEFFTGM